MFTAGATIFQHIMIELNGVDPREDRLMPITKNCMTTHERKWSLEFMGYKYDFAGEGQ
jgi:hypothetical protein